MVGPIEVKQKEVHRLDTEYNMWHWPLTSLMTLTLDVRVKFRNSCISGIVGLIDVTNEKRQRLSLSAFWGTEDIGVHIVHVSRVIMTYALE